MSIQVSVRRSEREWPKEEGGGRTVAGDAVTQLKGGAYDGDENSEPDLV